MQNPSFSPYNAKKKEIDALLATQIFKPFTSFVIALQPDEIGTVTTEQT